MKKVERFGCFCPYFMIFNATERYKYRGSPVSMVSISAILDIVQIENSTK